MKTRCEGCGAKIQTTDPTQKGYIKSEVYLKNPDNFYCERCFNLLHYNRNTEVEYSEAGFLDNVKKIAASGRLVVHVVDIFDLDGTVIKKINEYFPNNRILLVANKFDLFLNSVKVTKVRTYLNEFLKKQNIHAEKTLIISSLKEEDIERLLKNIYDMQDGQDVYLFGMTNTGKSSIINGINRFYKKETRIVVSNSISTTLDFIKIGLPNGTFIIDSPGIINDCQVTYYLDKANLNLLTPKTFIKPAAYQLNPEQALFIGGFAIIKFLKGTRSSMIVNVPSGLVIHRTKLGNADAFYSEHKDDLLKIPNENERAKMGKMMAHKFTFSEEKKDLTISGLGFVALVGSGEIEVLSFEKIKIGIREAIV